MSTLTDLKHNYPFNGNAVISVNDCGEIIIDQWGPDIYTRNHSKESLEYELNYDKPDLKPNTHYFVFLKVQNDGSVIIAAKARI